MEWRFHQKAITTLRVIGECRRQGHTQKLQIIERLRHVSDGDVIIPHTNKPASDTAEALIVRLA